MNKKGFTLIELLAVIIIIGLIAVITLPKINDSVEQSKKNLAEASALGYVKTIKEHVLTEEINKNRIKLNGEYNIDQNGNLYNETNNYELGYTGKKPKSGTLTYLNNELQSACITIDKYRVTITNDEIASSEKGQCQ
jgi:prepilin-type N-terminal cleavage/methylation domain-containing protein